MATAATRLIGADMIDVLDRHDRIALAFSGGKDSTACLWLLREHWSRITVYHLDTGDLLPEVVDVVDEVRKMVPHFITVQRDVTAWISTHGMPSDLLPHSAHPIGQAFAEGARLVSRYDCCGANLMMPLFAKIVDDGNTLLIRGTKTVDLRRLPMQSGEVLDGIELLLPLLDWSHDEVMRYLRDVGAPISTAYEHFTNLPECATCPAWWNEGRAAYLREHHPALFVRYQERMLGVTTELSPVIFALATEMRTLGAPTA